MCQAAALREETRGSHWRDDFPDRDDERFAGHFDAAHGRRRDRRWSSRRHRRPTRRWWSPMSDRPFDELPAALVDELADAGLDPLDVYAHVVAALAEDLPGGVDVTSEATIPADARAVADFGARGSGVVAGLGVAALALHTVVGDDLDRRAPRRRGQPRGRGRRGDARRRARPAGCSPPSAPPSTWPATSPASRPPPPAGSTRSRAPARGSSTPARPCRACVPCRSTPCGAAAGSTTGSRWATWRWSRTTT